MKCVISVLGKDRPGIVAAIATTLANQGGNLADISQTVLDDTFTMTMLATLDEEKTSFNELQDALTATGQELGVQVQVQRQDVFEYMYKI